MSPTIDAYGPYDDFGKFVLVSQYYSISCEGIGDRSFPGTVEVVENTAYCVNGIMGFDPTLSQPGDKVVAVQYFDTDTWASLGGGLPTLSGAEQLPGSWIVYGDGGEDPFLIQLQDQSSDELTSDLVLGVGFWSSISDFR